MRQIFLSILYIFAPLASCADSKDSTQKMTLDLPDHIMSALLDTSRPKSDRRRDPSRLPGQILSVTGLEPGMTVLEMEAGKGYFTEILSRAVGPDGVVHVQNPKKLDSFFGTDLVKRIERRPLKNVIVHTGDFDQLGPKDGIIDLVTWIQGPHEVWFRPQPNVSLGQPQSAFNDIFRVLKPGGIFLAVDHIAPRGSGISAGGTLHRADPDLVVQSATAAGFILEHEYDFLIRDNDDPTRPSYDGHVRGKTSQFVYRFTKPRT